MRDAFPGRYRPNKEDFDRLWEEGILVLDANVLLNLYRYSGDTREQMIAVLRRLKDRLWLPHQVAREFLDRRLGVIHNKRRSYEALREYLDNARAEAEQRLEGLHRDPITEAEDVLERVRDSLTLTAALRCRTVIDTLSSFVATLRGHIQEEIDRGRVSPIFSLGHPTRRAS